MSKIVFKKKQAEFLLTNIQNVKLKSRFLQDFNTGRIYVKNHPTDRYVFDLSENELTEILDELTFLITSKGLNKENEINDFGLMSEDIIDLIQKNSIQN